MVQNHLLQLLYELLIIEIINSLKLVNERVVTNMPNFHFEAVSTKTGMIRAKVDIITAPNKETNKSSHGIVAAKATRRETYL